MTMEILFDTYNDIQTQLDRRITVHNTRLAQWGLTSLIGTLCFYCKFALVDNLVFQNPPLRQAWERYVLFIDDEK